MGSHPTVYQLCWRTGRWPQHFPQQGMSCYQNPATPVYSKWVRKYFTGKEHNAWGDKCLSLEKSMPTDGKEKEKKIMPDHPFTVQPISKSYPMVSYLLKLPSWRVWRNTYICTWTMWCTIFSVTIFCFSSSPIRRMFPSVRSFTSLSLSRLSASWSGPVNLSTSARRLPAPSNASWQLFNSTRLNVISLPPGSSGGNDGRLSLSSKHSWAYIWQNVGSNTAFSNMRVITSWTDRRKEVNHKEMITPKAAE